MEDNRSVQCCIVCTQLYAHSFEHYYNFLGLGLMFPCAFFLCLVL